MIIQASKNSRLPLGRHQVIRTADFFENTIPSWLTVTGTLTRDNGTLKGVTSINSELTFELNKSECVSQKFYNVNFNNDTTANISIRISNSGGSKYFELCSNHDGEDEDILRYHDSNTDIENTDVDYIQGKRFWGLLSFGASKLGNKPRNLEMVLSPTNKFLAIVENDMLIYEWDFSSETVDFSGEWHFELSSDIAFNLSGLDYIIEKNI